MIHFEVIFVYGVRSESNFISFACGYPIFPVPFVKKALLSSLNEHILGNLEGNAHFQSYKLTHGKPEKTLLSHIQLTLRLCEAGSKR